MLYFYLKIHHAKMCLVAVLSNPLGSLQNTDFPGTKNKDSILRLEYTAGLVYWMAVIFPYCNF